MNSSVYRQKCEVRRQSIDANSNSRRQSIDANSYSRRQSIDANSYSRRQSIDANSSDAVRAATLQLQQQQQQEQEQQWQEQQQQEQDQPNDAARREAEEERVVAFQAEVARYQVAEEQWREELRKSQLTEEALRRQLREQAHRLAELEAGRVGGGAPGSGYAPATPVQGEGDWLGGAPPSTSSSVPIMDQEGRFLSQ